MIRFARLLTFSLALAFAVVPGVAEAQTAYWGQDNCFYSWNGRAYSTSLCRVVVAPSVVDHWNPQTRQWLLRIEDNPANMYIDYQFLHHPSVLGWVFRALRARPGEAVAVGFISVRNPQGAWTNTSAPSLSPAGQHAKDMAALIMGRSNNVISGIWTAPNCVSSPNGCR